MKPFCFLIMICFSQLLWAQKADSIFVFEKTIKQKAATIYADVMGNVYTITSNDQIKKFNIKGDSIAVFNLSKRLSTPSIVDVTYPLKTMFYFKSYNTIITTDRLLNITNNIDLRKADLFQVSAVAPSYDNQFWIYDEQLATLAKINNQGQVVQQSADLRQLIKETISPLHIIDNDNMVYIYDSAKGVYSFDYYGAYKNFTSFKGFGAIYISNKTFYGIANNTLTVKKENAITEQHYLLPIVEGSKQIIAVKNKIYYVRDNDIVIYLTNL